MPDTDTESRRDALTGLETLHAVSGLVRRARRHGGPVWAVLFDVNGTRQLNDLHGMGATDAGLASIARLLADHRSLGAVRAGGDQFLLLIGAEREAALAQVSALIAACKAQEIRSDDPYIITHGLSWSGPPSYRISLRARVVPLEQVAELSPLLGRMLNG